MSNIVFRCATFPFAWLGGRSHGEVFGTEPAPTPSAALIGATLFLASVLSGAAWYLWLTGTPVRAWAGPVALGLIVLQAIFFRQMLRSREVATTPWQGLACLALVAGTLAPSAWLTSLLIPTQFFAPQMAAHAAAVAGAHKTLTLHAQQFSSQLLRLQAAVATHQAEVARLTRQAQDIGLAVAAAAESAARCAREVEALRPLLPDTTSTDEDRAVVQSFAKLAARCERQQTNASIPAARLQARHPVQLQEAEKKLLAAQAELKTAQQAAPGPAFVAAQKTLQAADQTCMAWPSCGLQLAAAGGQLAHWEAWGSALLLFALVMLPAGLPWVLSADTPARQRGQVAAEEKLLDMAWRGGFLQVAASP
jgi:hypothetical protein